MEPVERFRPHADVITQYRGERRAVKAPRVWPRLVGLALAAVGLAVAGALTGPGTQPGPTPERIGPGLARHR